MKTAIEAETETSTSRRIVSRPLSVRLTLGVSSVVLGVLAAVIAGAATQSLIAVALGLLATAVLSVRGFRISLVADRDEIVVRNHFRTYRLRWEQVSHIGVGITSSIGAQFSAVIFRTRGESHVVAAQATTKGERECRRVVTELALLRPDLPIEYSE